MTRKRYIKLMMSYGVPRDHAVWLAEYARNTYVSYQDAMRQYWAFRGLSEDVLVFLESRCFSLGTVPMKIFLLSADIEYYFEMILALLHLGGKKNVNKANLFVIAGALLMVILMVRSIG